MYGLAAWHKRLYKILCEAASTNGHAHEAIATGYHKHKHEALATE